MSALVMGEAIICIIHPERLFCVNIFKYVRCDCIRFTARFLSEACDLLQLLFFPVAYSSTPESRVIGACAMTTD